MKTTQGITPGFALAEAVACLLLSALPGAAQATADTASPLSLELSENVVTVRTVTTGGRIVLFGFAHEEAHHLTRLVRYEQVLEDADGDGVLTLELAVQVPVASAWVAVDLSTGEAGAASLLDLSVRELVLPEGTIPSTLDRVDLELPMAEILVVRPGAGAWGLRVGDGGASDQDEVADGTLRAALASMWSVSDSPSPPERLAGGDVVVTIDPLQLRLAILRLAPPEEG